MLLLTIHAIMSPFATRLSAAGGAWICLDGEKAERAHPRTLGRQHSFMFSSLSVMRSSYSRTIAPFLPRPLSAHQWPRSMACATRPVAEMIAATAAAGAEVSGAVLAHDD